MSYIRVLFLILFLILKINKNKCILKWGIRHKGVFKSLSLLINNDNNFKLKLLFTCVCTCENQTKYALTIQRGSSHLTTKNNVSSIIKFESGKPQ